MEQILLLSMKSRHGQLDNTIMVSSSASSDLFRIHTHHHFSPPCITPRVNSSNGRAYDVLPNGGELVAPKKCHVCYLADSLVIKMDTPLLLLLNQSRIRHRVMILLLLLMVHRVGHRRGEHRGPWEATSVAMGE